MLPLYKLFSLFVRVFARPVINKTKQAHIRKAANGKSTHSRRFFIQLGNIYHKWDQKIDGKFMGIDQKTSDFFFKPLNDEMALEKGVEFFYEILIYSLLIVLPSYEIYRAHVDSKKKTEKDENKMKFLEESVQEMKNVLSDDRKKFENQIESSLQLQEQLNQFANVLVQNLETVHQNSNLYLDELRSLHNDVESIKNENLCLLNQIEQLSKKRE